MIHICTFPVEMPAIHEFFQKLGRGDDNRWYYISKDFLTEFFKITEEKNGYEIFMKELETGNLDIMDVVSSWLNIEPKAVLHLNVEETDMFVDLISASADTDVYENLMDMAFA